MRASGDAKRNNRDLETGEVDEDARDPFKSSQRSTF